MSTISSISGRIGAGTAADGSVQQPFRQGKTLESVVAQAHGKYYEATSRGNVYSVTNGATGKAPGTALGTTPAICLQNPRGSGKRLKIMRLDDESRLGHSPLTGDKARIVSIQPPSGFGREVWEELADKGFLKRDSGGFYELVEGK